MKRSLPVALVLGIASVCLFPKIPILVGGFSFGTPNLQAQEEGWKAEYDSVCSKTEVAMTLPRGELSALIDRCDRLRPRIELEEESTRKVYLRRLQMCRELYKYVLEEKESR